jgi:hypothetical protein
VVRAVAHERECRDGPLGTAFLGDGPVALGSNAQGSRFEALYAEVAPALRAATEIRDAGTFSFADQAVPYATWNAMFQRPR